MTNNEVYKKTLIKIYEQGNLYNFPNIEFDEFETEDLMDMRLILMQDEKGNYLLNQTDRKILLAAISDRYKGLDTAIEKEKRLQSSFAKDLFSKILQRQKNGFKKESSGASFRGLFLS